MSVWKDQKKGTWVAKFKLRNRQFKSIGFEKRSEALAWEVAKREEVLKPQQNQDQIRLTFSQVSNKYLTYCQGRFQKNTWRQKAFVYRSFLTHLQEDPIAEEVTKDTISDYLENCREDSGNKAANRYLKDLKALYNWAVRQEYFTRNPCTNIDNYPEERSIRYVPPAKDINKVLMTADPDDMDLLMVLYHTAGRIGEIFRLTWEDVNFEKRWIRLYTRKRRGGELQEDKLAMTDTIFEILKRRWEHCDKSVPWVFPNADGKEFSYSHKRTLMSRLCKKAGVKPFGFHAIRHHVASILCDSGKASLGQIQRLLRHKRGTTTDNYLNTLDPQLKQVANVLDEQFSLQADDANPASEKGFGQRGVH